MSFLGTNTWKTAVRKQQKRIRSSGYTQSDGIKIYPYWKEQVDAWTAILRGPKDSVFDGLVFVLRIHFPADFPTSPPDIRFMTPCWHPNVMQSEQDGRSAGEICIDLLKSNHGRTHAGWSPALNIYSVLLGIQSMLDDSNPDSPLNGAASLQFREFHDKKRSKENLRKIVRKVYNNYEQYGQRLPTENESLFEDKSPAFITRKGMKRTDKHTLYEKEEDEETAPPTKKCRK